MSELTDPSTPPQPPVPTPEPPDGEAPLAGTPPRVAVPTQAELDTLTVKERLDVLEAERQRAAADRERRRQTRHQWINSGVLLIGVILAGGSLLVSAISWRTGQDELRTSRVAVTV